MKQDKSYITDKRGPTFDTAWRDLIDGTIDSFIEAFNKHK